MKGKIVSWFHGSVCIQISRGSCERFLNLCVFHEINLWEVKPWKGGYTAWISQQNFRRMKPLARKSGVRIHILKKAGLPFLLFQNRKRKMMAAAAGIAFAGVCVLSLFIWDIRIEGNKTLSEERILDYLEGEGIHQGIWKNQLDYKELASCLRKEFGEITWVSVKPIGTRLLIELQENTDLRLLPERSYDPSDLVSDVDGIVSSILTRAGTTLVAEGSEVKKGDILVSGRIDLLDDSETVYESRYVAADADVYIQTTLRYRERISRKHQEKQYTGRSRQTASLQIGPADISLPGLPSSRLTTYDQTITTVQLKLMDFFPLPVYFRQSSQREYELTGEVYTEKQAETVLSDHLNHFLEKIQEKGVQIFQNNVKIETTDAVCTAEGTIRVVVKAGKRTGTKRIDLQKEGTPQE